MATLFRSPNKTLETYCGQFEFYLAVERIKGHNRRAVRFRASPQSPWAPIHQFPGRKPKGLMNAFKGYRHSVAVALASV